MDNFNRRRFLKRFGAAGASVAGLGALADLGMIGRASTWSLGSAAQAAEDYRALVCVFLYGGNDSNNMVIPNSSADYAVYAAGRGAIQIPQSSLLPIAPGNTAGRTFGLHPAMTALQGLFQNGKAALLANVGTLRAPVTKAQIQARSVPLPVNLFSHSDQEAQWQSSVSDGSGQTGWAGRLADVIASQNANPGATLSLDCRKRPRSCGHPYRVRQCNAGYP